MNRSSNCRAAEPLRSETENLMETKYYILLILLVIAAFMDAMTFKVKNALVAAGIIIGLYFCHTRDSFAGMIIPFLLLFPIYAVRLCGAADIKLLMMVGLYLGTGKLLNSLLPVTGAAVMTALCIGTVTKEKLLKVKIPFAVPVLIGVMTYLFSGGGR